MPTIEVNPTADISVQYVNPPKEEGKNASIKTADGQYYYMKPEMLPSFSRGMKCKVEYRATPKKDGSGEWRTITKIVGNGSAPVVPKNDYRARSNPAEAKNICVQAWSKSWIETMAPGEMSEVALEAIVRTCMRVYDKTLGGTQAQRRDDMDDEIPERM